jgi:DNA-binding NtrC family response regulator
MADPVKVLYVDSDHDFRRVMTVLFETMGYAVFPVGTIAEALLVSENVQFDLCLAELRLVDGRGTELLREFGQSNPGVPFLFIAGMDRYIEVAGTAGGAKCAYTIRPADPFELERAMARSISRSRRRPDPLSVPA